MGLGLRSAASRAGSAIEPSSLTKCSPTVTVGMRVRAGAMDGGWASAMDRVWASAVARVGAPDKVQPRSAQGALDQV